MTRQQHISSSPILEIKGLNVYYGASHALQGVDLTLDHGGVSVVGRNGMGKTTLCKAIMGLVPVASGSIVFDGEEISNRLPADIARLGIGYVPQGRRLWPSLTVDEHLKLVSSGHQGAWSIEKIYSTFPRLAERRDNGGNQLSGGEQQMLAVSRALLLNPRLLVMDEPTEGLAPVIVSQVAEILVQLEQSGDIDVLLIEQNIGVATSASDRVAIMVNGRINRTMDSGSLAGDRDLQQSLLGVGRHGDEPLPDEDSIVDKAPVKTGPRKVYVSNPKVPTRWTPPVATRQIEGSARTETTVESLSQSPGHVELRPLAFAGENIVLVVGTLDTKGTELRFIRDLLKADGVAVRMVDLSTSGHQSGAEIPPHQVAAYHPRGAAGVFTGDRGTSVAGMTLAFERWIARQSGIAGIISAGGSGGTALATPAMRALPVGIPKVMISTVASSDVQKYVGPADIMMLHSVADVQGLNSITRQVLGNGAHALSGMVKARRDDSRQTTQHPAELALPAIGLTMFGVTTTCVQQITAALEQEYDCLVFHATGVGGQSMENLIDSSLLEMVIDITTTEICDMMFGGMFPANEDRFGAMIRARLPYIGACGALDMVNFGPPDTVPENYRGRLFYEHNPQVTLMRTTPEENAEMGRWIGQRLNLMEAPVRFFLPEGGVSALDAQGQAFHDPVADKALFDALEATVRQTSSRQLIRLPHNINDPEFCDEVVRTFRSLHGGNRPNRQQARR